MILSESDTRAQLLKSQQHHSSIKAVHGGAVLSAVLELFGTFSFKRKSTRKKEDSFFEVVTIQ